MVQSSGQPWHDQQTGDGTCCSTSTHWRLCGSRPGFEGMPRVNNICCTSIRFGNHRNDINVKARRLVLLGLPHHIVKCCNINLKHGVL